MRFTSSVFAVGLLSAIPSAIGAIAISGPSPSAYWVQNDSNRVTWEFSTGDATPVTIIVTNSNDTYLNGAFPIAENVGLSDQSFTVTNVTLKVAPGYLVNFVNGSNTTQVYAQSGVFSVMSPGTPQASQAASSGSSPSATGSSAAGSGSVSASGASSSTSSTSNSSPRSFDGSLMTLVPMLGMSALMSVVGALVTL